MSKQVINFGSADDDHSGDKVRVAFSKAKANFDEVYNASAAVSYSAVTTTYAVVATDMGTVLRCDGTGGAFSVTLPAAPIDGSWVVIRKSDSGANQIKVVDDVAVERAWLNAARDEVQFIYQNGAWHALSWNIAPQFVPFTATGTLTRPPLSAAAYAWAIGPGGPGASGRRGATSSIRTGGGGGTAGYIVDKWFPAAAFGAELSTTAITVPGAVTGGAVQTVDSTNGTAATAGSPTTIGTLLTAAAGAPGASGSTASVTGTAVAPGAQTYGTPNISGGSSSTAAASAPAGSVAGSGGGGGSSDASNVVRNGGSGALGSVTTSPTSSAAHATPGVGGGSIADSTKQDGGGGGGGGDFTSAAIGNAGGNGGAPGGGGGGGSASDNTFNSGAGGNGGRGEARVTWYFY